MRPYYIGDAHQRLSKLKPADRKRVIAHARACAVMTADPGDIDRHLFVVTPRHLEYCGFKRHGPAPKPDIEKEFLDYWLETKDKVSATITTRKEWKRWMHMKGTIIHEAFVHYKAGWDAREAHA